MTSSVTEYILLKSARENLFARGFLLRVDFVALEQIESDTWFEKIPDNEKPVTRSYIQIDIISKIMMYVEDLVVLAKSFIAKKDFYSAFLAPSANDLGKVIKGFFEGIENLTNEEILKIMNWIDMTSFIFPNGLKRLVTRIQNDNIIKIRNILNELKEFGESNHPIYKRFKHGGMPVISPSVQGVPKIGPLASFDTFSIVSVGADPMEDIHIIPFSNAVLQNYKKLIERIQSILLEMIENRIKCLQRNIPCVFPKTYAMELSDAPEIKKIEKEIEKYYNERPVVFNPRNANYNIDTSDIREKIKWYFNTYL